MSIAASVAARVRSCALLLLLASQVQCRGRARGETETDVSRALCASACAAPATTCENAEVRAARQAGCVKLCSAVRRDAALAGCQSDQDRALRCLSTAKVTCELATSTRSVLERGSGVDGCQAEFARLERCSAPCREPGVVRSGTRSLPVRGQELDVIAEHVTLGCGPDEGKVERRSPPGAPCEHVSVCTRIRCPCPGSNAAYLARACVAGRCAADELSCALVPSAVGYDACPAR